MEDKPIKSVYRIFALFINNFLSGINVFSYFKWMINGTSSFSENTTISNTQIHMNSQIDNSMLIFFHIIISCFQCNIAITNFLDAHTCEIRFHDVIGPSTVHMYSYAKLLKQGWSTLPKEYVWTLI